ncbi:MAG: metallophosphoesterase, partial [Bacteroidales bacterium]|nr:metallophosphoesterase [Bacteroidales bacterium]
MKTDKKKYSILFWAGVPTGILAVLFLLFRFADVPFWRPFWRTYLIGMLAVLFLLYLFYAFLRLVGGRRFRRDAALATGGMFLICVYAMIVTTFHIRIDTVNMERENPKRTAPQGLHGYRILQISDLHIGSFTSPKQVRKIVRKALETKPDMVVFTGDMVNFSTSEMLPHLEALAQLQAPDGVYCVLGNHDYG